MSLLSTCPEIVAELNEGVLSLRFNRADKKNSITLAMYRALRELLLEARDNSSVRAVLFSGTEGCFTAGNDLQDFVLVAEVTMNHPTPAFVKTLAEFNKPLLAAVSGVAVGIGTTMLLHCDLVYADDSALYQLPFTQLGLCPEAASSYLLPRLMGYPKAAEWLLLGKRFNSQELLAQGLINDVVDNPLQAAQQAAAKIAQLPPAAVRATKALMRNNSMVGATIEKEFEVFAERLKGEEAGEALAAFVEKRKADFSRFE